MRGIYEKVKGSKDFYIRYTDANGKRHREHVGRESTAVETLVTRRREIRDGKFIAPHSIERISFKKLAEKMFIDKEGRGRDTTIQGNRRLLGRVFQLIGDMPVANVTTRNINDILRKLRDPMYPGQDRKQPRVGRKTINGKLSGASLNRFRALLSAVFTYGI